MQCLGSLEFLCDFHNMCNNTQKNFQPSGKERTSDNPEDRIENDTESDKENVFPNKDGKWKVKNTEHTKIWMDTEGSVIHENNDIEGREVERNNNPCFENLPLTDKLICDKANLDLTDCDKLRKQNNEKNITLDDDQKILNSEKIKSLSVGKSFLENSKKNIIKISRQEKSDQQSKVLLFSRSKGNKISKTIDNYFDKISPNKNEENVNPNDKYLPNVCDNVDEENIIVEEAVKNCSNESSIVIPSKKELLKIHSNSNDTVILNNDQITHAKEMLQLPNNYESVETQSLKLTKVASPVPEDEVEIMEREGTLKLQNVEQSRNSKSSTDQLMLLKSPTDENIITLFESTGTLKRKRPLSKSYEIELRFKDGKFAKLSKLITEQQKKEIETHYTVDMALVNQTQVNQNIIILDKCKFQCKICKTIYSRLDKCQVHVWRHLDMKPYLCKTCDFSTLTVSNIRCHIRKSHLKIKPFECHLCHKRYNSATLLEEHINVHTGARPYQCDFCSFASTSKQVLAHHILIHKSEKDIICDICGKAFYSKGRMRAHKITHNKDQAFKCSLCSTYVLHEEALDKHYANVHMKDYVCKICDKVYKSRKALHNHESVHSAAKFQCPMCPNVYKSTHILKEHILKHQGIRQYKCNNCNKSFAQQSHLAAHMAVHSNKTYNCPGCQKRFNRHDNMKVHAKRCDKFLADPELQSLLNKRKISVSNNHAAKVNKQREVDDTQLIEQNHELKNQSSKSLNEDPIIDNISLNPKKDITVIQNVLTSHEF